jgi:hypothetical protein
MLILLGPIFEKYKQRENRVILVKEVISLLPLYEEQKTLYVDVLEVLSDDELAIFYGRLTACIQIIEKYENDKSRIRREARSGTENLDSISTLLNAA